MHASLEERKLTGNVPVSVPMNSVKMVAMRKYMCTDSFSKKIFNSI